MAGPYMKYFLLGSSSWASEMVVVTLFVESPTVLSRVRVAWALRAGGHVGLGGHDAGVPAVGVLDAEDDFFELVSVAAGLRRTKNSPTRRTRMVTPPPTYQPILEGAGVVAGDGALM